jgi:hypothetical protein
MAEYYRGNIHRIVQRCRKSGPFVDIVHPASAERRWPEEHRREGQRQRR